MTGKPQPGRRVAILPVEDGTDPLPAGHEGLIAVHRGDPGLMLGYWNRPDEEAQVYRGEWFIGGDIGIIDHDGYLTHLGRANDVMNAFGYRVSPQERDDLSIIAAFIVPLAGTAIDTDAVKAFAATRLASYKCPRDVFIVDYLPRTANGKIKRSALRPASAAT